MCAQASAGWKGIRSQKEGRSHTTVYSTLKAVKKDLKAAAKMYNQAKSGSYSNSTLTAATKDKPQYKPIAMSMQKRAAAIANDIENRKKVSVSDANKTGIKILARLGEVKKEFGERPITAIKRANKLNERETEKIESRTGAIASRNRMSRVAERIEERTAYRHRATERQRGQHADRGAVRSIGVHQAEGHVVSMHHASQIKNAENKSSDNSNDNNCNSNKSQFPESSNEVIEMAI